MSTYLPGLLQVLVGGVFLIYAFRAHERFWSLGFLGWRKVYAGITLYLLGGLLNLWFQWSARASVEPLVMPQGIPLLTVALSIAGIGLLLAGSIERLRDLAEERSRLEAVRSGFDLFETMREVAAGPYAYLEVLDFSLKEMVRAADVTTGGLWLFNPSGREWILTGAANMAQAFRQQTESITGSGTGFDRLARLYKAHVFSRPEEIRLFFPEWEAEGYRSILGLPLVTGAVGRPERKLLGVIVLADSTEGFFDDDRVRRLHAAADYVAAVIAEARLNRETESLTKKLAAERMGHEDSRRAARQELETIHRTREEETRAWEESRQAMEMAHGAAMDAARVENTALDERLAAEQSQIRGLENRLEKLTRAKAAQAETFEEERRQFVEKSRLREEALSEKQEEFRAREAALVTENERVAAELVARTDQCRASEEAVRMQAARIEGVRQELTQENNRLEAELQELRDGQARREQEWVGTRDEERAQAADRERHYEELLAAERESRREGEEAHRTLKRDLQARLAGAEEQLQQIELDRVATVERLREERNQERTESRRRLHAVSDRLHAAQKSIRDVAASLRSPDPVDAALACFLPRLPAQCEVYLWRRTVTGAAELLSARSRGGADPVVRDIALSPWLFEADTIPAEGPRTISDPLHWAAQETRHGERHRAMWATVWGTERRPQWAVCWPWGAAGGPGTNGWITAYGFSGSAPTPSRIESLTAFVELLGALALSVEKPGESPVGVRSEASREGPPEPAAADPMAHPPRSLHDALISWVADQDADAWRLELAAQQVPEVVEPWLGETLEQCRRSCRSDGEDTAEEFLLATNTEGDRTILRMVNVAGMHRGDREPTYEDAAALLRGCAADADAPPLTGRWLMSGDHRFGLEVVFETPGGAEREDRLETETVSPGREDQLSVLVADDEAPMCELLVGMLETLGHAATGAAGARDASERFSARRYDLVIINADMPEGTGIKMVAWIKTKAPQVPVILVTELAGDQEAFGDACDRVLRKPFRLDQLQECLESLIPPPVGGRIDASAVDLE